MEEQKGKIMGLDYGVKRSGLAVSDLGQRIAFPLKYLATIELIPFLRGYLAQNRVLAMVVGKPLLLNGSAGAMMERVEAFVQELGLLFPKLAFHLADERFTSKLAQQALLSGGYGRKARQEKGRLDLMSATLILRTYLEGSVKVKEQAGL